MYLTTNQLEKVLICLFVIIFRSGFFHPLDFFLKSMTFHDGELPNLKRMKNLIKHHSQQSPSKEALDNDLELAICIPFYFLSMLFLFYLCQCTQLIIGVYLYSAL